MILEFFFVEGLSDDTSVLVVDFLPTSKTDWQKTYEKLGSAKGVMKRLRSWLNRSVRIFSINRFETLFWIHHYLRVWGHLARVISSKYTVELVLLLAPFSSLSFS